MFRQYLHNFSKMDRCTLAQSPVLRYIIPVAAKKTTSSSRIYVVVGTDDGQVREEALKLWNDLTKGVDDGFTHEVFEGSAANAMEAVDICARTTEALQTYSMFGGEKCVWLKGATFMGNDRTSEAEAALDSVEKLHSILSAGLAQGVSFLLSAAKIDKRRRFWKFLGEAASVQIFDKIDMGVDGWEGQVASLVEEKAKPLGLEFDDDALELFIMQAGEASGQIANELEKLSLFLGDCKQITLEDVRSIVPLSRAGVIFETGKALQAGNASRAISLIDEQLELGESAVAIIRASIIPTVRNLFMSRILIERAKASPFNYRDFESAVNRLPASEKAWLPQKKSGDGVNVYPLFMSAKGAQLFTLAALQKIMYATAKADKLLVTSGLDERLVLHRLVTEIASAIVPPQKSLRK